jgi:hypothetical protein
LTLSNESSCLYVQPKISDEFHSKLYIGDKPITHKYHDQKDDKHFA